MLADLTGVYSTMVQKNIFDLILHPTACLDNSMDVLKRAQKDDQNSSEQFLIGALDDAGRIRTEERVNACR